MEEEGPFSHCSWCYPWFLFTNKPLFALSPVSSYTMYPPQLPNPFHMPDCWICWSGQKYAKYTAPRPRPSPSFPNSPARKHRALWAGGWKKMTGKIESTQQIFVELIIFQTSPLNTSHHISRSLRLLANFYTLLIFVWPLFSQDQNLAPDPNQKGDEFKLTCETCERTTSSLCPLDLSLCCLTLLESLPTSSHSLIQESSVAPHWL